MSSLFKGLLAVLILAVVILVGYSFINKSDVSTDSVVLQESLLGAVAAVDWSVGDTLKTSAEVTIRESASSTSAALGTQPSGATGVIEQGPVSGEGFNWWKVNYATGVDGWTTGAYHYEVGETTTPVPGQFNYSVSGPESVTVTVGKSGIKSRVTVTKTDGTAVPVYFSTSNVPVGVRVSFLPSRCTPSTSCATVMTVTPTTSAAATTTTFYLKTTANSVARNWPINLTVVRTPAKPTTPVLTAPATGALNVPLDVSLTWSVSAAATAYNVQLATNSNFSGAQTVNGITATSYNPTLTANTKYWWRVQAVNSVGVSGWSSARYFTTTATAPEPTPDPIPDPTPDPTPVPTSQLKVGDRIRVTGDDLNIRSNTELGEASKIGVHNTGDLGTLIEGPAAGVGNNLTWWKVNYDSGVDGWNTENYITATDGTTPPPVLNFNLTDPAAVSFQQGSTASVEVKVNITESTLAQNIVLGIAGLPAGVSGVFNPATCTSSANGASTCDVSLGIASLGSAVPGTYTATITATGGGTSDTASLPITITAIPVSIPDPVVFQDPPRFKVGDKVQVSQGTLNIRSSTLIDLSTFLGTQAAGGSAGSVVDGPAIGSGNNMTWFKVDYDTGVDGWNTQNYLTWAAGTPSNPLPDPIPDPIPDPTPVYSNTFNAGQTVEVYNAGTLNVRSGPGTTFGVLGSKTNGATGVVQTDANSGLLVVETNGTQNNWWKVDFNGLVGWSVEAFLRLFQSTPVDPDPLPPVSSDKGIPVGINLEFPWNTLRSKLFADLIYSARPFAVKGAGVDANGWPMADFDVNLASESADIPSGADRIDMTGTFTLAFNGQANVGVVGGSLTGLTYNSATNQTVGQLTFAPSQDSTWNYELKFSNTKRTPSSAANTGLTNVRVIRPGHVSIVGGEYKASQKFSKEFLKDIEPFQVIRLMDYMETNLVWAEGDTDQRVATLGPDGMMGWSERPTENKQRSIDNYFGGPIEHMVELANVTGKDLWINIPNRAITDSSSDSYVKNLAIYLKNNLNSTSKVYLEWSNEVWNSGMFRQYRETEELAAALGIRGRWYTIKKIIEVSEVFRSVFGDAAMMTKIRPLYADQFASSGEASAALAWAYKTYPNTLDHYLYALAIAPYYGPPTGIVTPSDILSSLIGQINGRLNAIMDAGNRPGTYIDFYSLARAYGLKYFSYEGGTDFGYSSDNAVNKITAQYNPGMKDRTLGYLGQWDACGGDLFTYFNYSWAMTGKFQWGLTDNAGSPFRAQPKLQGATQAATTDRRYFECAPITSSFFSYNPSGVIGTGSGLTGTYYSDNNFTTVGKHKNGQPVVRIDPVINFIWNNYGVADPYARLDYTGGVHSFSTKWTGQIQPKFTGSYKFEMALNPGDSTAVKIQINNQWVSVLGSNVNLTAGTKYPIEITYQPNGDGGIARLYWSSTGGSNGNQIRAIVPRSQLYPN